MSGKPTDASGDDWKRKYYDTLDELDRQEKQWSGERDVWRKAVQRLSHAADSGDAELAKALAALRDAVRGDIDAARLNKHLALVSDRLVAIQGGTAQGQDGVADGSDPARVCALLVSEILYQLLERVSLPGELTERLNRLRLRVDEGASSGAWSGIMLEVSDLAADIRGKINRERVETESFLLQVTERLQELDMFFSDAARTRHESDAHRQALGKTMQEHVRGIATGMQQVGEIAALKEFIQQRLLLIQQHFQDFRRDEDKRGGDAETKIKALNERLAHVEAEARDLRGRVTQARQEALVDALTQLPNRLAYEERMAQEHARWRRFGTPLTLVVWDIDYFKKINDEYGHLAGDNALKSIAQLLASKVRETDFLARYGGEEFVLIMPGASARDAFTVAEKLRGLVSASHFKYHDKQVTITVSAGIAEFHGEDPAAEVFARADKALYRAKQQGRNRCVLA